MKSPLLLVIIPTLLLLVPGCEDATSPENDDNGNGSELSFDQKKANVLSDFEDAMYTMSSQNVNQPEDIASIDFQTPLTSATVLLTEAPLDPDLNVVYTLSTLLNLYTDPIYRDLVTGFPDTGSVQSPLPDFLLGFLPVDILSVLSLELVAGNFYTMMVSGLSNPDEIQARQTYLKTTLLPAVERMINSNSVVIMSTTPLMEYQFELTGRTFGLPSSESLYMDNTEFYMVDSYLYYLKSNIHMQLIIDFQQSDLSFEPGDVIDPDSLNNKLILNQDGQEQSFEFLQSFTTSTDQIIQSLTYLQSERDDQSNDIIKKNANLDESDLSELISEFEVLQNESEAFIQQLIDFINTGSIPDFPDIPGLPTIPGFSEPDIPVTLDI